VSKPRLLDLFCGAGGAAMGYHRAGFEVVGVDNKPQPHYPFPFLQMEALEAMDRLIRGEGLTFSNGETLYLKDFDAIHASPPCQLWSKSAKQWRIKGKVYPDYITPIRWRFFEIHCLYVIENVIEAPLIQPMILNGGDFGINIHRPRAFETNFHIPFRLNCQLKKPLKMGRTPTSDDVIQPVGHFAGVAEVGKRMGLIGLNQSELAQAIPPAYTEYIGKYLMKAVNKT